MKVFVFILCGTTIRKIENLSQAFQFTRKKAAEFVLNKCTAAALCFKQPDITTKLMSSAISFCEQ
jgi:hypothetical protein